MVDFEQDVNYVTSETLIYEKNRIDFNIRKQNVALKLTVYFVADKETENSNENSKGQINPYLPFIDGYREYFVEKWQGISNKDNNFVVYICREDEINYNDIYELKRQTFPLLDELNSADRLNYEKFLFEENEKIIRYVDLKDKSKYLTFLKSFIFNM